MQKNAKNRLFTLLAIVFFLILGAAVPDDALRDRAMAVGLGIDLDEDGNVVACAQILTSSENGNTDAGTRVVSGKSLLLNTAISDITEKCGQSLTVTHGNVVLLGEKLIESGHAPDVLITLLENTYVSDNSYVFACAGTPEDLFLTKSAFGQNASQYLQQLITAYGTYENIAYRTLRQIVMQHYSLGKTVYMPYVSIVEENPKVPPSSSLESLPTEKDATYDLNRVLILRDGQKIGVYGEHALRALNYILTDVKKGSEDFVIPGGEVGFFILENKTKKDFDLEHKTYSVRLEVGVTVKDYRPSGERKEGVFSYDLTEEDKKTCENTLKDEIISFYEEMRKKQADVFNLQQKFYAKYGKNNVKSSEIRLKIEVTLSVEK